MGVSGYVSARRSRGPDWSVSSQKMSLRRREVRVPEARVSATEAKSVRSWSCAVGKKSWRRAFSWAAASGSSWAKRIVGTEVIVLRKQ
jgi:hypothetical protein